MSSHFGWMRNFPFLLWNHRLWPKNFKNIPFSLPKNIIRREMSVVRENTRLTTASAGKVSVGHKFGDPKLPIHRRSDQFCRTEFHVPTNPEAVVSSFLEVFFFLEKVLIIALHDIRTLLVKEFNVTKNSSVSAKRNMRFAKIFLKRKSMLNLLVKALMVL